MHLGCRQLEVGTWAKNLAGGRPSRAGGVRKRNPQNEERGQSPELCASSCLVISVPGIPTALGTQDSWPPSLHSGQQTGAPCGEAPRSDRSASCCGVWGPSWGRGRLGICLPRPRVGQGWGFRLQRGLVLTFPGTKSSGLGAFGRMRSGLFTALGSPRIWSPELRPPRSWSRQSCRRSRG